MQHIEKKTQSRKTQLGKDSLKRIRKSSRQRERSKPKMKVKEPYNLITEVVKSIDLNGSLLDNIDKFSNNKIDKIFINGTIYDIDSEKYKSVLPEINAIKNTIESTTNDEKLVHDVLSECKNTYVIVNELESMLEFSDKIMPINILKIASQLRYNINKPLVILDKNGNFKATITYEELKKYWDWSIVLDNIEYDRLEKHWDSMVAKLKDEEFYNNLNHGSGYHEEWDNRDNWFYEDGPIKNKTEENYENN